MVSKWRSTLATVLLIAVQLNNSVPVQAAPFYVDYSYRPNPAVLMAYPLCILSPNAKLNIADMPKGRPELYAYISAVEVAPDADYRKKVEDLKIPVAGSNPDWNSLVMDITSPAWTEFVVKELAGEAVQKGFDGFFLDTVDSFNLIVREQPGRAEAIKTGMIRLIKAIKSAYPGKKILLNRGFEIWEDLRGSFDGMLIESVFRSWKPGTKDFLPAKPEDTAYLMERIDKLKAAGLPVYILDYVGPSMLADARDAAEKIDRAGCHAFVTTPELEGLALAPLHRIPRRVLALFGTDAAGAGDAIVWPVDSLIAKTFQMPLEWLGYEVDYHNVAFESLPNRVSDEYAAILLDTYLQIPAASEARTATWLLQQIQNGKRVLFIGAPHFSDANLSRIFQGLGVRGSGESIRPVTQLKFVHLDPRMNFEIGAPLSQVGFLDLQCPTNGHAYAIIEGKSPEGKTMHFHPVFTAPWGGMVLAPYVFYRRSDFEHMWLVNPFEFLKQALNTPEWPVPDTTTRAGRRLFYSHADGDGFRNESSAQIGKKSVEVLIDEILKKYPYPFTCSIIEAEIRGLVKDQDANEEARLVKIARDLFAMPQVEAASHSYTHPFYWQDTDHTSALYTEDNLELKPGIAPGKIDPEREIAGSIRYIESTLLPPGKRVEVFLWTGNCRPGPKAIGLCERLGVENMNGGYVVITKKNPSLTNVSPRSLMWGDELQVFCSHENDNIYRGVWQENGKESIPFYGGFMHALDSFKRTESPRRLKPVNIYFHWYSGDNLSALRAIKSLFDWAIAQPLHAVTAKQFARIVRDARRTELFQEMDGTWRIVNYGDSTNYRIRSTQGYPDVGTSQGVLGSVDAGEYRYVHTDGSGTVRLRLRETIPNHLQLESSTAPIRFARLNPGEAEFTTQDLRDAEVILAGSPPEAVAEVSINGARSNVASDKSGRIVLQLSKTAQVTVKIP